MRSFRIFVFLPVILFACKTTHYTPSAPTATRTEYIDRFSDLAIREMRRTGIPASIKMAQAILESGDGNSRLAQRGNNHFGIKCHDWTGRKIYHDDDQRNECFRRYSHPDESFYDHSDFLTGRARYANLFKLDPHDYKSWAKGLKAAGYATNPNYDRILIRIIEENELYKLDRGVRPEPGAGISERQVSRDPEPSTSAPGRKVMKRNRINYITAKEGDTYESITKEMELMPWELSRYNDIPSGANINPGDIIYLQPKRRRAERGSEIHIVSPGETIHDISQLYGIRMRRLLRRNHMEEGQQPSPGDTIYLRRDSKNLDRQGFGPEYDL